MDPYKVYAQADGVASASWISGNPFLLVAGMASKYIRLFDTRTCRLPLLCCYIIVVLV